MPDLSIRAWLSIAMAVLILGVVGVSRWQVHSLRADLAEAQAENTKLADHVGVQNAQIQAWKKEADALRQAAEQAQKTARDQRQRADRLSATLYGIKLPDTSTQEGECDALRTLVDAARTGGL